MQYEAESNKLDIKSLLRVIWYLNLLKNDNATYWLVYLYIYIIKIKFLHNSFFLKLGANLFLYECNSLVNLPDFTSSTSPKTSISESKAKR